MNRKPSRKLGTLGSFEYRRLLAVLRQVRWRWRLKVLLRGLALLLITGFATAALASWGVDAARYRPWAVMLLGLSTYGVLAYAAFRFVLRPLSRRITDRQVALYVEENSDLRSALLSAVEFGERGAGAAGAEISEEFVAKIVEDAARRSRDIDYGKAVDSPGLRRAFGSLGAVAATVALVLLVNPAFLRHGLPAIFRPFAGAEVETPYSIGVVPGSIEVARGSDQVISAGLAGFDSDSVEISYRVGDADWERQPMAPNQENGRYEYLLLRVAGDVEYFVEAAAVRSEVHRLRVVDRPYVERIDLELEFPEYSGMSVQRIEDGGDIAALAGTRVQVRVTPTVAVPGGRLVLDLERPDAGDGSGAVIELRSEGEALVGDLVVAAAGFYRVDLSTPEDDWIEASSTYLIEVLADQPPLISFDRPRRDVDATSVEEVFTELTAEDDFGLGSVDLVWTLNGADERREPLLASPGQARQRLTTAHTFYLEEFDLEPGDFIAYWAEATDTRDFGESQLGATDIYFIEVRPFEREYRQADAGGMQGGGGQQSSLGLADQQRQVVAATFKIVRDGRLATGGPAPGRAGGESAADDLEFLAGMEDSLVEQVRQTSSMFGGLGDAEQSLDGLEHLTTATEALTAAAEQLRAGDAAAALPLEQRALQALQRFEALFREMQVSQGQSEGGGGGDMERIEEMLELGMEDLQNQYESVQRGQQEELDNAVDEAMQRLQELARRQQQEMERQRASREQAGGGRGRDQRQLADEAEELARQLERLARQNSRPDLEDAANRLQQAADAMRRAATQSGQQGASAEGSRALGELEDARRLLDDMRGGRLDRDLRAARESFEQMQRAQERIAADVERLAEAGGRTSERVEELKERKDALAEDMRDLETQLDDMARESRGEQNRASRELKETADWMRDAKLADKVRYSKGVIEERDPRYAAGFEREIESDLEELGRRLTAAEGAVTVPEEQRLGAAVEDTRDLVERLESLEERARGQAPTGGGGTASGVPGGRQLGREFRERVADAERLRAALDEQGVQVTDLDQVIGAMRDFDEDFVGTTRGLDALREDVIDNLKLFEFWLRRVTDQAAGTAPQLGGSDRVPEGYRDLVEEYFRELARQGQQQ